MFSNFACVVFFAKENLLVGNMKRETRPSEKGEGTDQREEWGKGKTTHPELSPDLTRNPDRAHTRHETK